MPPLEIAFSNCIFTCFSLVFMLLLLFRVDSIHVYGLLNRNSVAVYLRNGSYTNYASMYYISTVLISIQVLKNFFIW